MAKSPAWQRAEGKNPEGGLNEKGRASLRAAGHDIKRPQPEGGSRKDSFCARMKGMKAKLTSSETANDPDSRINKSLRKWNCHADGGAVDVARQYKAGGGSLLKRAVKAIREYPLAPKSEWYGDANYEQTGGKLTHMSPKEYLSQVRPLEVDDVSRENIDNLKQHMQSGKTLDPLAIYESGKEDGRHRAHAAQELGIQSIPVLDWRKSHGGAVDVARSYRADGGKLKRGPEVGSSEYWDERNRRYSIPPADPMSPVNPDDVITPDEYRKGYIGRKEYVLSSGGRAHAATGGDQSIDDGNRNYIQSLYQNVLGRSADQPGLDYWSNRLSSGEVGEGDILQQFAGSKEFQNQYGTDPTKAVTSLYQEALGRAPEQTGLDYWVGRAKQGLGLPEMVGGFLGSQEGQNVSGISQMYQDYTGNVATPEQIAQGQKLLGAGQDWGSFLDKTFPISDESDAYEVAGPWQSRVTAVPKTSSELMGALGPIEQKYGLPQGYLMGMMGIESAYGTNQQRKKSKYAGAFQLSPDLQKQYGVTNPYDFIQSADAAAQYARDNAKIFKQKTGRDPQAGDLYGMHQQGAGGFSGIAANPNLSAAQALMKSAPSSYRTLAKAINAIRQNLPSDMRKQASSMSASDFANYYSNKLGAKMSGPDQSGAQAIANYYANNPPVTLASGTQQTGTTAINPNAVYNAQMEKYKSDKAAYDKFVADYVASQVAQGKPAVSPPAGVGPAQPNPPNYQNIVQQLTQAGAGGNAGAAGMVNPTGAPTAPLVVPNAGYQAPDINFTTQPFGDKAVLDANIKSLDDAASQAFYGGSTGGTQWTGSPATAGSVVLAPLVGPGGAVSGTGGVGLAPAMNFNHGGAVEIARSYRKAGGPVWDRPRPKSLGKPEKLSPDEKSSAKAAAKAAGRPYPNLVDNMRAAREDGGRLSPFMEAKIRDIGDAELGKYGIGPNAPSSTKDELKAGPEQSTWEKIAEKAMGDRPSPERRRFVEGMGTAADVAHMGSYLTPLAPYVGALDFARGVASGDPMEAALGATGLPGKGAKVAGMAASAMMPESAEAGPLVKALNAIRAYHGSPHKFDKFDISKIGTGEGAQAYGHGLYFADAEDVAKSYRGTPQTDISKEFKDWSKQLFENQGNYDNIVAYLKDKNNIPLSVKKHLNELSDEDVANAVAQAYIKPSTFKMPTGGHMYEVNIHANPEHMLDWDKPLLQQSRHVIDRFNDAVAPVRDADDAMLRELFGDKSAHVSLNLFDRSKGSQAYNTLGERYGSLDWPITADADTRAEFRRKGAAGAAEALREAGIPGIKYLDQGSRGAGEGTSNYVVFDPNIIEILRRYKQGGSV